MARPGGLALDGAVSPGRNGTVKGAFGVAHTMRVAHPRAPDRLPRPRVLTGYRASAPGLVGEGSRPHGTLVPRLQADKGFHGTPTAPSRASGHGRSRVGGTARGTPPGRFHEEPEGGPQAA